jgi:hypothetical protein
VTTTADRNTDPSGTATIISSMKVTSFTTGVRCKIRMSIAVGKFSQKAWERSLIIRGRMAAAYLRAVLGRTAAAIMP